MRTMTTTIEHPCPAQPVQAGLDKQGCGQSVVDRLELSGGQ